MSTSGAGAAKREIITLDEEEFRQSLRSMLLGRLDRKNHAKRKNFKIKLLQMLKKRGVLVKVK
jgi:hypothetical protein